MKHDKKMTGETITVIFVKEIGSFEMKTMNFSELLDLLKGVI